MKGILLQLDFAKANYSLLLDFMFQLENIILETTLFNGSGFVINFFSNGNTTSLIKGMRPFQVHYSSCVQSISKNDQRKS